MSAKCESKPFSLFDWCTTKVGNIASGAVAFVETKSLFYPIQIEIVFKIIFAIYC